MPFAKDRMTYRDFVRTMLEDYLRGIGTVEDLGDRFRARLPGPKISTFDRLTGPSAWRPEGERVFEVVVGKRPNGKDLVQVHLGTPDGVTEGIGMGFVHEVDRYSPFYWDGTIWGNEIIKEPSGHWHFGNRKTKKDRKDLVYILES